MIKRKFKNNWGEQGKIHYTHTLTHTHTHTHTHTKPREGWQQNLSSETMQVKRQWHNIFKVLKEKPVNLEFHTQWKYLLKIDEIKIFSDIKKMKEFIAGRPTLQEVLKKFLQMEEKWYLMKYGSTKECRAQEMVIWVNTSFFLLLKSL